MKSAIIPNPGDLIVIMYGTMNLSLFVCHVFGFLVPYLDLEVIRFGTPPFKPSA